MSTPSNLQSDLVLDVARRIERAAAFVDPVSFVWELVEARDLTPEEGWLALAAARVAPPPPPEGGLGNRTFPAATHGA
jgi:hypothetical protein